MSTFVHIIRQPRERELRLACIAASSATVPTASIASTTVTATCDASDLSILKAEYRDTSSSIKFFLAFEHNIDNKGGQQHYNSLYYFTATMIVSTSFETQMSIFPVIATEYNSRIDITATTKIGTTTVPTSTPSLTVGELTQ
ncbi:hypothetical protein MBLNU459_g5067t1 [Dothideomycetes sp. NU459]